MKIRLSALCLIVVAACIASAQAPPPRSAQAAQSSLPAATATMLQQRAEAYLRNFYAWGPDYQVSPGAPKPSAIPDLYEIEVEVALRGQSDSAVVYVTKDGKYMVRGDVSDMSVDPYAAVRQKLVLDGAPSMGPADAKTVLVEFGDFQCPSCRQLDLVLRKLLPEHPEVRFVFKDFPLEQIHPWAMTAALVGRCAYQQSNEVFWKVHDLIYDNQDQITPETASDKLVQLATQAGADPARLKSCVADPKTTESVRNSMNEGHSVDVEGTPTTLVNGRTVVGPNESLLRQYIAFQRQVSGQ